MFAKYNFSNCKFICRWSVCRISLGVTVGMIFCFVGPSPFVKNERRDPAVDANNAQNAELFRQVSSVSPSKFSDIECFVDTSVDETIHCRFHFVELEDIDEIIAVNHLVPRVNTPSYLNSFGIFGAEYPDWYDLRTIPIDSKVYRNSSSPEKSMHIWLYVDVESKTAYFETMTK